jgi:hypothetical protein
MTNLRLKTGLAFHTKEQLVWPATKDAFDFMPSPYVVQKLSMDNIEGTPLKVHTCTIQHTRLKACESPSFPNLTSLFYAKFFDACKMLISNVLVTDTRGRQKCQHAWLVATDAGQ